MEIETTAFLSISDIIYFVDQVYSNTRVPTRINTSQHESTRVRQESTRVRHESL